MEHEKNQEQQNNYVRIRWLITGAALLIIVFRVIFPSLSIDAVSLGLIILALVPWLSPIIKSIEITGIGKIEFQEIKSQVEQLQGAVQSANLKADLATASVSPKDEPKSDSLPKQRLSELAKKYVETRRKLRSGAERTTLMGQIFSEMVLQANKIEDLNVDELLADSDTGNRLSAYAYLFAKPSVQRLDAILNSVMVETKPFNQYWGIQVIRKTISQIYPQEISREIVEKLKRLLKTLEINTDRYYETKNIIDNLAN